jgi:hypothetical protein
MCEVGLLVYIKKFVRWPNMNNNQFMKLTSIF